MTGQKLRIYLALIVLLLALGIWVDHQRLNTRRVLTAELYPFLPRAEDLYRRFEQDYEREHPNIDLHINLNQRYYDSTKGLLSRHADVYEIDCIFLPDMVQAGKIQPLGRSVPIEFPLTYAGRYKGVAYADPHWLCGYFLFYDKSDSALHHARGPEDLAAELNDSVPDQSFVMDLKTPAALGEIYLNSLLALGLSNVTIDSMLKAPGLYAPVLSNLRILRRSFHRSLSKDDGYIYTPGALVKMFAGHAGRAYGGYSESMHYALEAPEANGLPSRRPKDIGLRNFPLAKSDRPRYVGWVDALSVDSRCHGTKRADCLDLIHALISPAFYTRHLNNLGQYLLPPHRKDYHMDARRALPWKLHLQNAAFYEEIEGAVDKLVPYSSTRLSQRLLAKGNLLADSLNVQKRWVGVP